MKYTSRKDALLLLEDGTVFKGKAAGKTGTFGGELCFNTGMTGYQEIYTDPSYYGQIIVNTTSHIGNYGTIAYEQEYDKPTVSGVVVNEFSRIQSRHDADATLQDYLVANGVVAISDVDTRQIVRHIRSKGAMNAIISSEILDEKELMKELKKVPSMAGLELSSVVSTPTAYTLGDEAGLKVAVLDLGIKKSILDNLVARGCFLKVYPAKTSFSEMKSWNPQGFFISNGPGDPAVMAYATDTVKEILAADIPLFGICLGHQILAQANAVSTYKMHHGHRGLNHPVKNLESGKSEITSQNHGFAVSEEAIKMAPQIEVTHRNLNDNTIEGIRIKGKKAFSVQYHPESSPGPHDSRYLFDQFIQMINQ